MMNKIPNGVYPTMLTPFTKDNKIDYNGVAALLEWYSKKGVDGIFAICQSSEIFFLSFEEKLELLKFIGKNRPKGITLIASGHTADGSEAQIEEAKAYIDVGIDAYVFISNRFAAADESDDVLLSRVENVVSRLPEIAFGVYECPYPYKRVLSPKVAKEMAHTGKFCFLKDTCCDLTMIKDKLDAVSGTNFKIFNANSATIFPSLKLGCAGFSGVMANFTPELYSYLCKHYSDDPEKCALLQDFLGFFSVAECQAYPVNAKYYLGLDGVPIGIETRSRSAKDLTYSRRAEIEQMYALTKRFKEYVGITV